ncbi:Uncharacterized protein PBTT_07043 [Plasmodiophora brassicae]|uniref:Uncharacterized protein n=1 Tax=Plasmodiophora brassicae TaxID=37360 RepID=A0A0G4J8Y0_PLABS|nr:hypothetical protein PBRA_003353 [Plasmodiophora brassicae]SPQ99705.1 unnamed protein product [Plasmodiophora brassicae]
MSTAVLPPPDIVLNGADAGQPSEALAPPVTHDNGTANNGALRRSSRQPKPVASSAMQVDSDFVASAVAAGSGDGQATPASSPVPSQARPDVVVRDDGAGGMVVVVRQWKSSDARRPRPPPARSTVPRRRAPATQPRRLSLPAPARTTTHLEDPVEAALPLLALMESCGGANGVPTTNMSDDDDEDCYDGDPFNSNVDNCSDYVCIMVGGPNWSRRGCGGDLIGDLVDDMDEDDADEKVNMEFWVAPRQSLLQKDLNQLEDINNYELERSAGGSLHDRMRYIKQLFKQHSFRRVRDLYKARRKGHLTIARYISLLYFVRL